MDDKRAKFLRIYSDLPEELRNEIIVLIDEKTYTWNTAYLQISESTSLGEKILKTLENIGII